MLGEHGDNLAVRWFNQVREIWQVAYTDIQREMTASSSATTVTAGELEKYPGLAVSLITDMKSCYLYS